MFRRIIIVTILVLAPFWGQAQCAMCKAVTESSTAAGTSTATGINEGILYLMAFPYLILGAVAFAIYRHRKAQAAN